MAIRNVGRNKRRSVLAFISVAFSLTVIVFAQGYIAGFKASYVKNATKNEAGHIRIAHKKFEERNKFLPVNYMIKNYNSLINLIKQNKNIIKDVSIITPRIVFGVILSHNNLTKQALIYSGDLKTEQNLLYLRKFLILPSIYPLSSKEIIIGEILAKDLKYKIGDTARVMAVGSDNALHLKKFVICGIFKTGIRMYDETIIQMGIKDAADLLKTENSCQQIVIMLKNYEKADVVAKRIRELIKDPQILVTPWTKIGDTYTNLKLVSNIYAWLFVIIALLGAFIINNIMMMVVFERRKEIGILKSMGFSKNQILMIFLSEGILLGLVGSIVGVLLGSIITVFLHYYGIDLTLWMSKINFPLDNVIYPRLELIDILFSFLLGTILAGIVSAGPAFRAAKMNAIDAIKSV